MSSIASSLSSGKRSKAEELALRRAQLERRAARQKQQTAPPSIQAGASEVGTVAAPSVASLADASGDITRTGSYEEDERVAKEEAHAERVAREKAERRSNDMALRALEAERTKRIEAEKLLELEREHSAQLLSKIDRRDRRKFERTSAAITIQARWRGHWARECLLGGREEMERQATTLQSHFRGFKVRVGCLLDLAPPHRVDSKRGRSATGSESSEGEEAPNFCATATSRIPARAPRAEANGEAPGAPLARAPRRRSSRPPAGSLPPTNGTPVLCLRLQPTGEQKSFVFGGASLAAPMLAALQMQLDDDLLTGPVTPGGAADAQGVEQGMRLVSVNGSSLLGETLDEATRKLDLAPKPWDLVLERLAGKEDTGRTLFQLVQQIKKDVSHATHPLCARAAGVSHRDQ